LTKAFSDGTSELRAVTDVSFEIEAGTFAAITGASGSGKSTLLHLLGGIESPTEGEIWVAGLPVHSLRDRDLARYRLTQVGFVFQAFHLIPNLNVFNNVALPGLLAGVPSSALKERVTRLLESTGIGDKGNSLPHELSGGQQQRAAIARALVTEPAILLADEPTGNLDTASSVEIMRLLVELNEDGRTVVLITHEDDIAKFAKRVIRLKDGLILEDHFQQQRVEVSA
jgi:putative ABC transport system ATP-binding protein